MFTSHSPFSCSFSTQRPSILFWRCPLFRADQRNLQVPPTLICLQFMPVTPFTQLSFVCQKANNSDPEFYLEKLTLKKEALKCSSSSVKPTLTNAPAFMPFPFLHTRHSITQSFITPCMLSACYLPCTLLGAGIRKAKTDPAPPLQEFRARWQAQGSSYTSLPPYLPSSPHQLPDQLPVTAPVSYAALFLSAHKCLSSKSPPYVPDYMWVVMKNLEIGLCLKLVLTVIQG